MKKYLFGLLAILMTSFMCVSFTSCDKDDNEIIVLGTWSGHEGRDELKLTFKGDGTGSYWLFESNHHYNGTFTYIMEGDNKGKAYVRFYDSDYGYENQTVFFVIEGKAMSLYEGYYYEDLEWILTKQ